MQSSPKVVSFLKKTTLIPLVSSHVGHWDITHIEYSLDHHNDFLMVNHRFESFDLCTMNARDKGELKS